jgi:hypothetical protein
MKAETNGKKAPRQPGRQTLNAACGCKHNQGTLTLERRGMWAAAPGIGDR